MVKMDIESVLNKYFEGETTAEEERQLRAYFYQENLPDNLKELAPIFTYIEDERIALKALKEITDESSHSTKAIEKSWLTRPLIISLLAAASLISIFFLFSPGDNNSETGVNYAWINGRRITNQTEIKMFAEKSLENVASSENIFLEQMSSVFEENKGEQ